MNYRKLEAALPERLLISLKAQGKTDTEIAQTYALSPADILLLREWYGIKPARVKPPKLSPDLNRKSRIKRPVLSILRDLHKYNWMEPPRFLKWSRNEEIYEQYKNGADLKELAKLYFVTEKYLKGFVVRRERQERIKAGTQYQETKGKVLSPELLAQYKVEGKSDIDIGHLHDMSLDLIRKLRQEFGIQAAHAYRRVSITDQIREMILDEYRRGRPINDICRTHGIGRLRFSTLLSPHLTAEDKLQRRAVGYDHEGQRSELLRLQQIHKTDAAIGQALGITRQRVHQMRIKFGITPLPFKRSKSPCTERQSQRAKSK